jgi:ligand-binding SRPBCC domain-containing protein
MATGHRNDQLLLREQRLAAPLERVFEMFADAGNLEALTPPLLNFRIVSELPIEMRVGAVIEYRLRVHMAPVFWRTRIVEWDPPHRFADMQERGPYALWHHTHTFEGEGEGTLMRDQVRWRIGYGPAGEIARRLFVQRDLERIFDFRREAIGRLLENDAMGRSAS